MEDRKRISELMKLAFDETTVDVSSNGKEFTLTSEDRTIRAELLQSESGKFDLLIDGKRVTAYVSSDKTKRWVTVGGQTFLLTKSSGARKGRHAGLHTAGELTAPMPGQVRAVNVREGEAVAKGQTLLVLEAMKMEIRVQAPRAGIVKKLFVNQGQTVEREQTLIEVDES
jgi:acetyl/propionyl-CoA carboxylase alpha subunit